MSEPRPAPDRDRLLGAKLCGEALHHAKWRALTDEETAAAVTEIRQLAGGRADLLAEQAGLLLGFGEGTLSEPLRRCAAQLLVAAGADESLIPGWAEEGRRRRPRLRRPASADAPPAWLLLLSRRLWVRARSACGAARPRRANARRGGCRVLAGLRVMPGEHRRR